MTGLKPLIPSRRLSQIIIRPVEMTIVAAGVEQEAARQVSEVIAGYRPALQFLAEKRITLK